MKGPVPGEFVGRAGQQLSGLWKLFIVVFRICQRRLCQSAPLHKETNCHDDDREYYRGLNYIRQSHVLHLAGLFRQFDSAGMFLVALVLLSKDFLEPFCLLFCNPLIDRPGLWPMKNSPQPSHLRVPISCKPSAFRRLLFFIATAFIALPASKGKSSVSFGPYRKTNPQSAEDHKGDPGRKQMKGCGNHQNYSDQQGHIGPLDAIFGGHDTCPLHSRSRGQFTLIRLPLFRLLLHVLRLRGLCGFAQFD